MLVRCFCRMSSFMYLICCLRKGMCVWCLLICSSIMLKGIWLIVCLSC